MKSTIKCAKIIVESHIVILCWTGFSLPLFRSRLLVSRQEGSRLCLMPVADEPLAGTRMQVLQRRPSRDHHPHGKFRVGRLPWLPLPFSYEKFTNLLHIQRAQYNIQPLSKTSIIGHRSFSQPFMRSFV